MAPKQTFMCVLLMTAVLVAMGCTERAHEPPPNVLFVLVDTLRADRLGARGLTPFLDELADRGTVFQNAYSTSSWTLPAIASLFTSSHQSQHGVVSFRSKLVDEDETLAETLAAAGYRNLGYSANPLITGPRGFGQGFEDWAFFRPKKFRKDGRQLVRARFLTEKILAGLDSPSERSEAPTFVYAHYVDPHSPYDPPRELRRRFVGEAVSDGAIAEANEKLRKLAVDELTGAEKALLVSLYDAEIAYFDAELARLFGQLDSRGFFENAIIVVTSDHGEEFFEHGMLLHGLSLYEESVRIPLIVIAPGIAGGHVVQQRVSLLDLAPTLLDLAGLSEQPRFAGRSFAPLMRGETQSAPEPIALELASKAEEVDLRVHAEGVILGSDKIVVHPNGRRSFYDLDRDAGELHVLDTSQVPAASQLLEALAAIDGSAPDSVTDAASPRAEIEPSEQEKAHLRSLGYVVE